MKQESLVDRQLGNYRVERVIGRGGMAQVYYGLDVKLQRPVAIKVIDARYRDDPSYAQRFVREAQTAAAWRHENIVQVYFADEEEGLYYFAMEYVDGQSLAEILADLEREGEMMAYDEVVRIGRAMASALDYAHDKGVIHRDVKPGNVLLDHEGRVVLSDFGLAMDVRQGTQGEVFGSSHYIAPEQARSSADAVPQSDLYSLGVILFEMLTGVVPFDDPSPTSVALQHVTQPPPSPRELNPHLGPEVEAVLLKALSKLPGERFQSGAALIDALEVALQAPPPVQAVAGDNLLGQNLDEYRLEALLGRGGMARIYRGLDVRLKRHVAIKVIDTPFRADSEHVKRFEREAQAIAQLEHPQIVRLYRYGECDGVLYMAMQYIEGTDLRSVLAGYRDRGELIPVAEARRIVGDVCTALDYAHGKGVIHRDVKPSNIMIDEEGRAILTDFGLALVIEAGTQGEVLGSLHYIAPEQAISSAGAVAQSDLYAVGVILYEMFSGQVPFDADDPLDIALLHMSEAPRPPRELRPGLSPALEAVILKTLAKEPQERYATGADLLQALDEALETMPAEPAPAAAPAPKVEEEKEALRPLPPIPAAVAAPPAEPEEEKTVAEPRPAVAAAAPPPARRSVYLGIGAALLALVVISIVAYLVWGGGGRTGNTPAPTQTLAVAAAASSTTTAGATRTPASTASATVEVVETVAPTVLATASPTAEPTDTPQSTAPLQATASPEVTAPLQATATEAPTQAPSPTPTREEPTASPTATATATAEPSPAATATPTRQPTALPTATPVTLAGLQGWIIFLSNRTGQEAVFAMRPDGSEVISLPDRKLYNQVAGREMLEPGGDRWLEVRTQEGNSDIWRVGTAEDLRLTSNPAPDYDPAWSPDGRRMVFVSGRGGSDDLWLMDMGAQGEYQLTYYGGYDKHPTWSPDGTQIAFWSDRETGRKQIWIIGADGNNMYNLSEGPYDDWDPVWVK